MKIYSFGEKTKPAILLLPGTCCHWKRNFGHVIPLLQEHFYVLCASYDGFDETEDSTFPNMLIETAKLENYIQKNLGGQLFAAYGCSLGGSFVGLMVQRKKIHIRHGILGSSDLDQGSSFGTWAMAKAMTPLLGKMLRSGKLPVWAKRKWKKKPVPSMRRQCCSCSGAVPLRRSCLPWHLCPIRAFSTSSFPIW
ncbi:MAG: alpha/beta fold hydrolase [Gallintestinimicrobium sp.]